MSKIAVSLTIEKELIEKVDKYTEELGGGSTRSGVVNDAIQYYLRNRMGFRFLKK